MTLVEEHRTLEAERRELERERNAFLRYVENENRHLEQQKNLFETKFRILEEEMIKLATEREEMDRKKSYYERLEESQNNSLSQTSNQQIGEIFFRGVSSRMTLKKRYKDLIKIYHPDNVAGDHALVVEINKEYAHLSQILL